MRLASRDESRRIDERTSREVGVGSDALMEAAGARTAGEILRLYRTLLRKKGNIGIVCGPGNNGGDGLVVARILHSAEIRTVIFLLAPSEKRSELFKLQLSRATRLEMEVVDLEADPSAVSRLSEMNLLVDAIFGIGLRSEVGSSYAELIQAMNSVSSSGSGVPIVSLDVPSGLDCDRGVACGEAIRAQQTLTFGVAKPGFFVSAGPEHVGHLKTLAIGFSPNVVREEAKAFSAFTRADAKRSLPQRAQQSNKTSHGHAAVFAGREGMWGAALLSATAAYRIGAGYVTLASFNEPYRVTPGTAEFLTAVADEESLWTSRRFQVAAVGPGLGTGRETAELIERLKASGVRSVVLDADAITVAAREKLYPFPKDWILTPHAGELSRLIGASAKEIENNRFVFAMEAARQTGCLVLLKGYRTVVANANHASVILAGNSALAKAGTGDVLTGMITGLLAQGLEPRRAAELGAFVHGSLADEWVSKGNDPSSLQASDLSKRLPRLLAELRDRKKSSGAK